MELARLKPQFVLARSPFLDVARPNVDRRPHWSVERGFRAVVQPCSVGRIALGYGTKGLGIEIGHDYPF